jgi:7-carboxy-7-deazaguanine synthase
MDGPAPAEHTAAAVAYCKAHPRWRLSLQTHKLIGIPESCCRSCRGSPPCR